MFLLDVFSPLGNLSGKSHCQKSSAYIYGCSPAATRIYLVQTFTKSNSLPLSLADMWANNERLSDLFKAPFELLRM